MFLMPGMVVAAYVTGRGDITHMLTEPTRRAMLVYLRNHQLADGGWGTHIESASTMFGSVLSYVSMRLLGVPADDPQVVAGRNFIHSEGGAIYTSSWAKFWLAILGVYDYDGLNTTPVEMWLLPKWFPFHPGKLWCHCRMVYLPMGYLYCARVDYNKISGGSDSVIQSLRKELYCQPYESINWSQCRHVVASRDNYSPLHWVMKRVFDLAHVYEKLFASPKHFLRQRGLAFALDYISVEDIQTNFIDIGPVSKIMNMLAVWHDNGFSTDSDQWTRHVSRIPDYLWVAEDGMKMQGYNGSQMWDTAFAIQAIYHHAISEDKIPKRFPDTANRVWSYLERTQILSTETSKATGANPYEESHLRARYFRHVSRGGWPFSTSAHGWPISDCSAEGLRAVLMLRSLQCNREGVSSGNLREISEERLFDCVNVIITLQNKDGGWASYENKRGGSWYEYLNPSEVFGDIMVDYSYIECSSASVQALRDFQKQFPHHRADEIEVALKRAQKFFVSLLRDDGLWYGSWGVCFTYAAWFGVEGLVACGLSTKSPIFARVSKELIKRQNDNGGWGESFLSSYAKEYVPISGRTLPSHKQANKEEDASNVVHTAWALIALITVGADEAAIEAGVSYLVQKQEVSGDWPQQGITGVFNRSCGITYTAYRNVFPIWALSLYRLKLK